MSVTKKSTTAKVAKKLVATTVDVVAVQAEMHAQAALAAPFLANVKAAQDLLKAALVESGADALTYNGVEVAGFDTVNGHELDWDGLIAEFPGAAKYRTPKTSNRFNGKKPLAVDA